MISGLGLVYNPGVHVEGFSNFLWTVLSAVPIWFGAPVGKVMLFLGTLFSVGTIWLVWLFIWEKTKNNVLAFFGALLLAVDGSFALWSVSGMETGMFSFLVFLGAFLFVRYRNSQRILLSVFVFWIAALTRLEGVIFFLITIFWWLGWSILVEKKFPKGWLLSVLLFGGLFLPYFLWRYWYYGYPFPNSFYAKVNFTNPLLPVGRGIGYLVNFFLGHLGVVTIPIIGYSLFWSGKKFFSGKNEDFFWQGYFLALILVCFSYVTLVGGDWSIGRFFVPILPRMSILLVFGMNLVGERLFEKGIWEKPVGILVMAMFGIALCFSSSYQGEFVGFIQREHAGEIAIERIQIGKWLKKNVPPNTLIAVDAAGAIPFFSELPTIDMFGMNDEYIAHEDNPNLGLGVAGHEKFDLGYVLWWKPEYILVTGEKLVPNLRSYQLSKSGKYVLIFQQ